MASNGLLNRAKNGTCRICQRVRNTDKYLNIVGEVRHGFATGHVWECKDKAACIEVAKDKLKNKKGSGVMLSRIETALKISI